MQAEKFSTIETKLKSKHIQTNKPMFTSSHSASYRELPLVLHILANVALNAGNSTQLGSGRVSNSPFGLDTA
jgi:hypothetical protein